jgi:toxin-antitoxin system PIN domain toxin
MSIALLDVNVLIALVDTDHTHHQSAAKWFVKAFRSGWATCPITQNGFVRIMSQPSYPNRMPVAAAAEALRKACRSEYHQFWPCDVSLLDEEAVSAAKVLGPNGVTDAYLLALAVAGGGRLATLDRRIAPAVVPGASAHHLWDVLNDQA